jgi:site-specific DNA recombinase
MIPRPESEHVTTVLPDLRIIPEKLWDTVQARLRRFDRPKGGRTAGSTKSAAPSILAGLLRCGLCGGSMIVVHRTTKDGYSYATLGCTTNKSRGAAICKNDRSVSERKIRTSVIEMLSSQLTAPDLVARFVTVFQKRVGELQQTSAGPDPTVRLVQEQDRRVKNLYEGLAKMGWSEGLAEQIKSEETKLSALRAKAAERPRAQPVTIPHPKIIEGYIRNLLTVLEGDPAQAREILARHIQPLVLTPTEVGYQITGAFDLATVIRGADSGVSENGSRRDRD